MNHYEYNVLSELERMVEHFEVFANNHSREATTETWAALYCAKAAIRMAKHPQATHCAACGEYKHTPLRRDEMGGYVCLNCIDERLAFLSGRSASDAN